MFDSTNTVGWIASEGGPLLLLGQSLLAAWQGRFPLTQGRVVSAGSRLAGPDSPATDYDRACDVQDYLGIISVGDGEGLVLGDEPLPTSWWPLPDGSGGILARPVYWESEKSVFRPLQAVPNDRFKPTGLQFRANDTIHVLFDSALTGREVASEDHLNMELARGLYEIETAEYFAGRRSEHAVNQPV